MKTLLTKSITICLAFILLLPASASAVALTEQQVSQLEQIKQSLESIQVALPNVGKVLGVSTSASVTFDGISEGEVVADTVYVTAIPNGITNVSKVRFQIDGKNANSEGVAPYTLGGDSNGVLNGYSTTNLADGTHTLTAIVTADGETYSESIDFVVGGASTTPDPDPEPEVVDTENNNDTDNTSDENEEATPAEASTPDPVQDEVVINNNGPVYKTSDLGWAAGSDIRTKFNTLLTTGALKNGGTLLFDDFYKYVDSGNTTLDLPDDLVLAGSYYGAGFDIQNVPWTGRSQVMFGAGKNLTLYNFTITNTDSPRNGGTMKGYLGGSRESEWISARIFQTDGDMKIINSKIQSGIGIHVRTGGGEGFLLKDSHISGGYWTINWIGSPVDPIVDNTLFENSMGDGIKGGAYGGLVTDTVFLNNGRDGIDTTRGLQDTVIQDSYFVNMFKGFDIKTGYDPKKTQAEVVEELNTRIYIRNNEFVNTRGVAAITLDRGKSDGTKWITNANKDDLLTQKIYVDDNTFISTESCMKAMILQELHSVFWNDNTFLGCLTEAAIVRNTVQSGAIDPNVTTNYNLVGSGSIIDRSNQTYKGDSYYRSKAGPNTNLTYSGGTIDTSAPSAPSVPSDPTPSTPAEPTESTSDQSSDQTTKEVETEGKDVTTGGGNNSGNSKKVTRSDVSPESSTPKNRLRTTSNLNVRATPGGSLVRMVTLGTAGEKLDVPAIQQGGHTWVKVRFDNGTEGYVAETYTQAETTSNSSGLTDSERRAKIADLRAQLLQLLVLLLELKSR